MQRVLDPGGARFDDLVDDDPNPFVRYRRLFHSWHVATSHGLTDDDYIDLVRRLDKEVAGVDGHGFVVTPFGRAGELSEQLGFRGGGGVWVKDETGNVSGSHKARHMMGLLVHLEVVEQTGMVGPGGRGLPDLAIASCGNAALGAAVVARAAGRRLQVFVPTWGDPKVIARLEELGATVNVAPRVEGQAGDPTYHALTRAIEAGALPFTCQGNENGLVIEGGMTLGYELASQLNEEGSPMNRLFVQVGGGALASAVIRGFREAVSLGAIAEVPAVYTVQTEGGHPLERAYDRLARRILDRLAAAGDSDTETTDVSYFDGKRLRPSDFEHEQAYARTHRSEFMWPWEEEPASIATGILDDETYDWFAVVTGMLETGGRPIVVGEATLEEANRIARESTGIDVDHTGSSGLAGLLDLRRRGAVEAGERVGVLFTGVRR